MEHKNNRTLERRWLPPYGLHSVAGAPLQVLDADSHRVVATLSGHVQPVHAVAASGVRRQDVKSGPDSNAHRVGTLQNDCVGANLVLYGIPES